MKEEGKARHPIPAQFVELYGLFAVLLVLLPEWLEALVGKKAEKEPEKTSGSKERARGHRHYRLRRPRPVQQLEEPEQQQSEPEAPLAEPDPMALPVDQPWLINGRSRQEEPIDADFEEVPQRVDGPDAGTRPEQNRRLGVLALGGVLVALAGGGALWVMQHQPPLQSVEGSALRIEKPELVLRAVAPSWVEVRNPDGETLYGAILDGEIKLPLGPGLRVLAGRPDLVRVKVGAGPGSWLGRIDEVRWIQFPRR